MITRFGRRCAAILGMALVALSPRPLAAQPAAPDAAAPAASRTDLDYRLGAGDKIRVIVFGEESLSGQFVVSGNGKVALPLVGDVSAADRTVTQFQENVQAALREGYLKDPKVSVEVLTYRPFYILGEVNRPGEYPYSSGLTVLNAVATAGGFTYRAQTKRVFIRRNAETKESSYDLTSQTPVAPGDTIRIGERFF